MIATRDGRAETPTPTTVAASPLPPYLFPERPRDGTPAPSFLDPIELVEAYLQNRSLDAPEGLTFEFRFASKSPDEVSGVVGYSMTVASAGGTDGAIGTVSVEQVDGSWFVVNASSTLLRIDSVRFEGGVVSGTITPTVGGAYLVTLSEAAPVDSPRPIAIRPMTIEAGHNEPTSWSFGDVDGDVVRVTFWHSPSAEHPAPAAVFAELTLARGSVITTTQPPVSRSGNVVIAPALVGLTVEEATKMLDEADVAYELFATPVELGDPRAGTVVEQYPPAGGPMDASDAVQLTHAVAVPLDVPDSAP